jgi:hypothetical protein
MGWDNKSRYALAGEAAPHRAGCPKAGDVAAMWIDSTRLGLREAIFAT